MKVLPLPIAVRAYAVPKKRGGKQRSIKGSRKSYAKPDFVLFVAVQPSRDHSQRLLWGAYRVYEGESFIEEGYFYGDDLPKAEIGRLRSYCTQNTQVQSNIPLRCLSRRVFLEKVFYAIAFQVRSAIVGFDLPFVMSRLAERWSKGRGFYAGGFNFTMLTYDDNGVSKPDSFTPRVSIKSMDSQRANIAFTSVRETIRAKWKDFSDYRCQFIDARTLALALTGDRQDLNSACKVFGISLPDVSAENDEIGELRNNLAKINDLYFSLIAEYEKHPIDLPPGRAFSSASIGKAYFRKMGIRRPQMHIDKGLKASLNDIYGWAMSAYFGGRTETRITKVEVPVVYLDFRSMYPTVNVLMGIWDFLRAKEIEVADCTQRAKEVVNGVTRADLFNPLFWKGLTVLVELRPDSDILPMRARFTNSPSAPFTTALNPLKSEKPMWFTLADVITSKLLTGKTPEIIRAIRFLPVGIKTGLNKVRLRGSIDFCPIEDDFFKLAVEEKYKQGEGSEAERLKRFLKTMVNSICYGIFVELNRQEESGEVSVYGLEKFYTDVEHVELPGKFFFPPLAALTPGAARLMLALAEVELIDIGGTYSFMDTDSLAIISAPLGELIPMPGGKERLQDGSEAIRAISWLELEGIRKKFECLNPYDQNFISGSILRLEDENLRLDRNSRRRSRAALLLRRLLKKICFV